MGRRTARELKIQEGVGSFGGGWGGGLYWKTHRLQAQGTRVRGRCMPGMPGRLATEGARWWVHSSCCSVAGRCQNNPACPHLRHATPLARLASRLAHLPHVAHCPGARGAGRSQIGSG